MPAVRFTVCKPGVGQLARPAVDRLFYFVHAKRFGPGKANRHNSKREIHARGRTYPTEITNPELTNWRSYSARNACMQSLTNRLEQSSNRAPSYRERTL